MTTIKNYPNYRVTTEGEVWSYAQTKPKTLKPQKTTQNGKYLQVRLYGDDARITKKGARLGKLYYIHRLIWETLVGEIPPLLTIDHIDGNPANNRLDNLQLVTQSENSIKGNAKRRRHDLWENRDEVIKKVKELGSQRKAAQFYNCSDVTIFRVVNNKTRRRGNKWM